MKDLSKLSDDDLLKELQRRKVETAMTLEQKIEDLKPKPVENPDFTKLKDLFIEYIDDRSKGEYIDDDIYTWAFEEGLVSIMGKDAFEKLREIDSLRSGKKK